MGHFAPLGKEIPQAKGMQAFGGRSARGLKTIADARFEDPIDVTFAGYHAVWPGHRPGHPSQTPQM
jgi:hypothetical protein